jgi:hypothetical protein
VAIFEMDNAKQLRKLYTHYSAVLVVEMADGQETRVIPLLWTIRANQQAKWKVFPLLDFRLGSRY